MTPPAIPPRMRDLPRDHAGRVVPWFVAWVDGKPDHRIVRGGAVMEAVRKRCCWLCGDTSDETFTFVIGPMCVVNHLSAEPPMHEDCAMYAASVCPFLTKPHMRRRTAGMPEETSAPAGIMLKRNPGVTVVWTTKRFTLEPSPDGPLFRLGAPTRLAWLCEGRPATRDEATAALESGLPALAALADEEGIDAHFALHQQVKRARSFLPEMLAERFDG